MRDQLAKDKIQSLKEGVWELMSFFFEYVFCMVLLMEEIRRSPVEVGSLSHFLQGFIHSGWCRISSTNSMLTFKRGMDQESFYLPKKRPPTIPPRLINGKLHRKPSKSKKVPTEERLKEVSANH